VFTLVDGITVLITRTKSRNPTGRGGYIVSPVHTYPERINPGSLDAAIRARELFENQTPDPDSEYGHLGPRVDYRDWKCDLSLQFRIRNRSPKKDGKKYRVPSKNA
jgi:hypothetical protein